jgi:enoyl-CoA hydratase/carnithine racemase
MMTTRMVPAAEGLQLGMVNEVHTIARSVEAHAGAAHRLMALALWREAPLEEVLQVMREDLQRPGGGEAGAVQAGKSAIFQARTRPGSEVMRRPAELGGTARSSPRAGERRVSVSPAAARRRRSR